MAFVNTLDANEVEFVAENELVDIFPSTNLGILHLIADDYGPLRTNSMVPVPLWLARQLRRCKLCRLVPPSWLTIEFLNDVLDQETAHREDFQKVPFHYIEVATIILECASEDVPNSELVRIAIQRLRELRGAKMQAGLPLIDGNPLKLNNVGHMELNEIRPFLLGVLDHFSQLTTVELEERKSRTQMHSSIIPPPRSSSNLFPLDHHPNPQSP